MKWTIFTLFSFLLPSLLQARAFEEGEVILTPHGMGMHSSQRVVIPVTDGHLPPLPCVLRDSGTHEHGSSFSKGNFHYLCTNGTAEVMACISEDGSVIQLGRTFVKNGIRNKCNVAGDTVTYEQESMCYENGVHYNVGDSFRNGSFKLTCKDEGIAIDGCYLQNSAYETLMVGESRILGHYRHECELVAAGKVRYTVKVIGCVREDEVYNINQVFTDRHVRYQCMQDGTLQVLGCVDDGLFVELGRDLLINGLLHRCYKVDRTTFYHKFPCDTSLAECIANSITPRRLF